MNKIFPRWAMTKTAIHLRDRWRGNHIFSLGKRRRDGQWQWGDTRERRKHFEGIQRQKLWVGNPLRKEVQSAAAAATQPLATGDQDMVTRVRKRATLPIQERNVPRWFLQRLLGRILCTWPSYRMEAIDSLKVPTVKWRSLSKSDD